MVFSGTVAVGEPPLKMHFQVQLQYMNLHGKRIIRSGSNTRTTPVNEFSGAAAAMQPSLKMFFLVRLWHCNRL
jgi:hypothetical protein